MAVCARRNNRQCVVLSSAILCWRNDAWADVLLAGVVTPAPPVEVLLVVLRGRDWRRSDIDNRIKPAIDLLKLAQVIEDDDEQHVVRVQIELAAERVTGPSRLLATVRSVGV